MIELLRLTAQWWIFLFFLGITALPLTTKLFSVFFDKGYAFSKIIGLICLSYIIFVLSTVRILPFTTLSTFGVLIILTTASICMLRKSDMLEQIKNNWKTFLFEEVLFFAGLLFWSYIKSFQPDIHGLEKFMDYGFINSILRTNYFPAKDMWMSPLSINYYYFGHLMTAVMTRLTFLPSNITFNLMLTSMLGFTFSQGFSLGANLVFFLKKNSSQTIKKFSLVAAGLLTALLLTFGGNLHTIYTFFTPYQNESPVPPTQLVFSPLTFPNQYWYPNATRFIYHTIHEFPIYSFVVSDLHGHVLDIPAVLLMIALLLAFFINQKQSVKSFFLSSALFGFLAAIMYMTNAWDGLIYIGVCAMLLFMQRYKQSVFTTLFSKNFFSSFIILFFTFILTGLPFSLFFKPFASQIGINCAPDFLIRLGHIGPIIFENGYCQTSPLWQLAILYGFFFFWFVSLISFVFFRKDNTEKQPVDLFVVGLGALAFVLILLPEFVYLKDIYTTYFRANTMFKLVYQSFILLMLMSGYTIYRIYTSFQFTKKNSLVKKLIGTTYLLFGNLLITLILIYPFFAIPAYFNNLKNFQGLNGTKYLQNINTDDYKAVQWFNTQVVGQPVILEAQGDSYTDYERISSNTGLPTVFGWMVHEWLWRGTYDVVPQRIADVKALYESPSITETKNLLKKYNVQYIYIGDMERNKYPALDEGKFAKLGTIAYHANSVTVYKINH